MKDRDHHHVVLKKRISACKKRLEKLKKEGFVFSNDIYTDLESLKNKILEPSLSHRISRKKRQITIGIISILFLFVIVYILSNIIPPIMKISVDNIYDSMIIDETFTINGTASHSNGKIQSIQVIIDKNLPENATIKIIDTGSVLWSYEMNVDWSYELNVDNIINGPHTITFQCIDGQTSPVSINRNIVIKKKEPEISKPTIMIDYPTHLSTVKGIINIYGNASSDNGQIQQVEIQFDGGENITVFNGSANWSYNWDTKTVNNTIHSISVRCYDNNRTPSDTYLIYVTVENPLNQTFLWPDITGKDVFQMYIIENDELMEPNKTYFVTGYHRKIKGFLFTDTYSYLEISKKPEWLIVSLPEQPIVTPPDYEKYTFQIEISITDDAPKNVKTSFTITSNYGRPNQVIFLNNMPYDIDINTGQW